MYSLATCALQSIKVGADGSPPRRVCLLPAPVDGVIKGRDGRAWTCADPLSVLRQVKAAGAPLTIDENHSTQRSAPSGGPSPALARIPVDALSVDPNGAIWGEPDWTPYGEQRLKEGAYLGLSPALLFDGSDPREGTLGEVKGLASAGLVNDPNLDLPVSLNAAQPTLEETTMDPKLLALLGLPEDADQAAVNAAVEKLAKPETPSEPAPAPAAAPAVNSAEEAPKWALQLNERLAKIEEAQKAAAAPAEPTAAHETAVNAAIERFTSEGKITPGMKDLAVAQCATEDGLKAFVAFYEQAPKLVAEIPALNNAAPGANGQELTEVQAMLADQMGLTHDEFKAAK